MSTATPTAFLLWAILSVLFLGFLIYHLWSYDKFRCLHWSAGRQPGAFKRIMTYSYLASVPLLVVYSVATTVIKFQEGFIMLPDHKIIPRPLNMYSPKNRDWIIPLGFVFSVAWGLELVTHLEELAFWLYLLHQNPRKAEWFESWEYRMWYLGSMAAFIGMPLTALVARRDVITLDAYIFLVGSSGSTCTTLCFLYVIWEFPRFLKHVKAEGADPVVVVRLATFYNLNLARVVFRFLFTIPLFIVALDGIVGVQHQINKSVFWTDFLLMIAGIGCFVSTTITLLIFFPRSFTKEAGYKPKLPTAANSPKSPPITPNAQHATRPMSGWSAHHPSIPTTPHIGSPVESRWGSQYYPADSQPQILEDEDAEGYDEGYSAGNGQQQPWYPDEAPPYHGQVEASSSVHYGHAYPEQAAYQRQPFPHSTSSPYISGAAFTPPPSSPAPVFIPNEQDLPQPTPASPPIARAPRRSSKRKSSMNQMAAAIDVHRYSGGQPRPPRPESGPAGIGMTLPEEDASTSSIAKPVATTIHEIPMRAAILQTNAHVRRQDSKSSLHPYVMTFTSPIDLADLNPPELPDPRRFV